MNLNLMNEFFMHYATCSTYQPLTFTAVEPNTVLQMNRKGNLVQLTAELDYNINGGAWLPYSWNETEGFPITLANVGDYCQFRAKKFNKHFCMSYKDGYRIKHTAKEIDCSGNISSIIEPNGQVEQIPENSSYFYRFFSEGSRLKTLPILDVPIVSGWGYRQLYGSYSGITATHGSLCLAKELSEGGEHLEAMYQWTNIQYPGEYPNLRHLKQSSFSGCYYLTKIVVPPDFSKILSYGVKSCFEICRDCKNLTEAIPLNPQATFEANAFQLAYKDCSALNHIKFPYKQWPENVFTNWVEGVSPTGVFECPQELPQIFDSSHIPPGWEVKTF